MLKSRRQDAASLFSSGKQKIGGKEKTGFGAATETVCE